MHTNKTPHPAPQPPAWPQQRTQAQRTQPLLVIVETLAQPNHPAPLALFVPHKRARAQARANAVPLPEVTVLPTATSCTSCFLCHAEGWNQATIPTPAPLPEVTPPAHRARPRHPCTAHHQARAAAPPITPHCTSATPTATSSILPLRHQSRLTAPAPRPRPRRPSCRRAGTCGPASCRPQRPARSPPPRATCSIWVVGGGEFQAGRRTGVGEYGGGGLKLAGVVGAGLSTALG